jgi:hypothetical protein
MVIVYEISTRIISIASEGPMKQYTNELTEMLAALTRITIYSRTTRRNER